MRNPVGWVAAVAALSMTGLACDSEPLGNASYSYFYAESGDGARVLAVRTGTASSVRLASALPGHQLNGVLAFDQQLVYFADEQIPAGNDLPSGGRVMAIPRLGGVPTALMSGLDEIYGMAVNGEALYLLDVADTGDTISSFVGRLPLAGGDVQHLADIPGAQAFPIGIAVHAGYVYWTQRDGNVLRVPAGGGATEALASGEQNPGAIAVDDGGAYWLNAVSLGVDCTPANGALRRLDAGATAAVTLASGLAGAASLAIDTNGAYWSTAGSICISTHGRFDVGTVFGLSAANPAPFTASAQLTGPSNLFLDEQTLYFTVEDSTGAMTPVALRR
jgi:hypothetical protein